MINPHEIQQKEFSKAVRGYREEEVDTFLDMLTVDFEKLIYENQKLNDEIERLKAAIRFRRERNTIILDKTTILHISLKTINKQRNTRLHQRKH